MYNHHVHSMKLDDLTSQIIFQQSPISTQIFDPSGVSLMANKAWEKLWGVKHEQIGTYNILKDKQLVETGTMPFIKRGFEGETVLVPAIRYEPGKTIDLSGVVSYRYVSESGFLLKNCIIYLVNFKELMQIRITKGWELDYILPIKLSLPMEGR